MGALVPAGASISGEPASATTNRSATLTVAGPGIYAYRWKLNNGPWSAEVPLTTNILIAPTMFDQAQPIRLTNLADGTYTVSVIGKNSAGYWQSTNNPTASKTWTVTSPAELDTDGDGMPDTWESAHQLDPEDPSDATEDADGDGANNLGEFIAGTDPQDDTSVLKVLSESASGGTFTLAFTAVAGQSYAVLYTTNLPAQHWATLTNIDPQPATTTVHATDPGAGAGRERYYRLRTSAAP
jgi:hypothetical protein